MAKSSRPVHGAEINKVIARRVARLRKAASLSFDSLAARSDLSKGVLVGIEQGTANPSIGTLCKLAATFRVSLTELLAEDAPRPSVVQIVAPEEAKELWRGPKGGRAILVVGATGPDMLELWEWTLFPGEEFQSRGHPQDTVELLSVIEGTLSLEMEGIDHLIGASHRAVARADRPHTYRCHGRKCTRFTMVVQEPGDGANDPRTWGS